jgi:high-affinity Fe2+/Pb2+ permease
MAHSWDYQGAVLVAASTLGGAVAGIVSTVLLFWLLGVVFGESEALGQGFLILAALVVLVPLGASLAGRTAFKLRRKQRANRPQAGLMQS